VNFLTKHLRWISRFGIENSDIGIEKVVRSPYGGEKMEGEKDIGNEFEGIKQEFSQLKKAIRNKKGLGNKYLDLTTHIVAFEQKFRGKRVELVLADNDYIKRSVPHKNGRLRGILFGITINDKPADKYAIHCAIVIPCPKDLQDGISLIKLSIDKIEAIRELENFEKILF
jgi:hypothetical protein